MSRVAHILLIVDPAAGGPQSAVDKATHLARCMGASLEILVCEALPLHDTAVSLHAQAAAQRSARLLDQLETHAAPARASGLNVTQRRIHGKSLCDSMLKDIRDSNADLVVKDMHDHSLTRQTLQTKIDWHLSRNCPVPLLLTKSRAWNQPPAIMASVDPDPANESAVASSRDTLNCAASLAARLSGELHVIHTFIPAAFAKVVAAGRPAPNREYSDTLQLENAYKSWEMEHLVAAYGVAPGHVHIEMGAPSDCLPRAADHYHIDVMVMGASSHGRWRRTVVGRTAPGLLEALPCDVIIINQEACLP